MDVESKSQMNLRRLRQNKWVRDLSSEVQLCETRMIQPLFAVEGLRERTEVPGLTDVFRETPLTLLKQIESDLEKGVRKFILFGVPHHKASHDFNFDFTTRQIADIKSRFGTDLWLAVDVCLCSATESGQCGVLHPSGQSLLNAETVDVLSRMAFEFAQAGADCVAPSDMMDGRIRSIRQRLDQHGLDHTVLMSYAAKFHSSFYGPFRVAADSAPKGQGGLKDRATYQIDPSRTQDALACALRDLAEGADILMVKPGLPYLDIISRLARLKAESSNASATPWAAPLAAYQVSGEFAAIELLAKEGLAHRVRAHLEAWTSLTRAGAPIIITYGARKAREWIYQNEQNTK